jgi:hypothetical protein
MAIQEHVIRKLDTLFWQVWLGDQLLDCHTTYWAAIREAEALAREASQRGERSKIVVGPVSGVRVEFPTIEPELRPANGRWKKPRRSGAEVPCNCRGREPASDQWRRRWFCSTALRPGQCSVGSDGSVSTGE